MLPKQLVNSDNTTEILRFALENFKKDIKIKYIVLFVPHLVVPSIERGNVAIISNQTELLLKYN